MKCWRPDDISKDRQPACGGVRDIDRRRQAGIGDHRRAAHRQPLVAGMRRMQQRRAGGVVMAQDGGDAVVDGGAHAVEAGEAAVLVAEEAQRRQHAVDGADQRGGRRLGLVGVGLAQRQEVGQQFHDGHRIARDVAAVGQDLAVESPRRGCGWRCAAPRPAPAATARQRRARCGRAAGPCRPAFPRTIERR